MARYLVTGGAGFIGSHLVDLLVEEDHEVLILDDFSSGKQENVNPAATVFANDILDTDRLHRILEMNLDGCFHLAARPIVQDSIRDWKGCSEVNALGTVNLFSALSRDPDTSVPVVYASSCAVYGGTGSEGLGLKETDPIDPQSPYAVDKYANELHARVGMITRGLKSAGARFFNVYGPRQDPRSPYSGVVSKFVENSKEGKPLTIFGDGGQTRDFIHVYDVVELLVRAMKLASTNAPVLNFGTGKAVSINELAEVIIQASGKSLAVERRAGRIGDVRHSLADNSKIRMELGFNQFRPLDEGLQGLLF